MQEYDGQNDCQYYARFVEGDHLAHVACLYGLEVAQSRKSGGKYEECDGFRRQVAHLSDVSAENGCTPCYQQYDAGSYCCGRIRVDVLDSRLCKYCRQCGEQGRQQRV